MYKILIADDDALMREVLKIMISKVEGFEVVYSVGNGEEAIEICEMNEIDIVFMDIMMPGESGIECSKKIYSHNPNIIIFIVSSYDNFDFAIEALNTKVKAYISKPVSFIQIKNLLEDYKAENKFKIDEKYIYNYDYIFSVIKENDFRRMYYEIPKIIENISSSEGNEINLIKEKIINIGQKLIDSVELSKSESKNVQDIFLINNFWMKDKRYFEFWLFDVTNYVFQKNSINKNNIFKSVFDYIEDHIEEYIGLNEITNNCSVSQGYLSRIFKRQFNVSVMEYLHMRKINIAKNYFCFTDLSITDVSFKLGYNESSYFSKVFKKYENITIYKYKRRI